MIPIVTPAQMRAIDAAAPEPVDELIRRAAWHVARRARAMLGGVYGRRVTIIAGPGNNGADGRVAGALLSGWGVHVTVVAPGEPLRLPTDLVIDAAFGTGMNRPYTSPVIAGTPVLAVDITSGVDGLTGEVLGDPVRADHTVTFAALKPGLLLGAGPTLSGEVEVVDIGLDTSGASAWRFELEDAAERFPHRRSTDHKWKRAVWVLGGSPGMAGAPQLAAQAALRAGAGMVRCSMPGCEVPQESSEVVFHALPESDWHGEVATEQARFGALVVGPGLGRSVESQASVQQLLAHSSKPVVVDADALHLLGESPTLRADVVLTPHDGEYAAIMGHAPQPDRFEAARNLAKSTGATVLLKGPCTIVAEPNGSCLAVTHGDQRLATAGTGDVLAGIIAAYLAAGLAPASAAALGAWMHAEAGHRAGTAPGLIATDLLDGLAGAARDLPAATKRSGRSS